MPERMVKLEHLPLMDFPICQKPMIKHLVDVVKDEADDFDRENIRALIKARGFEGAACAGSLSTVGVLAPRSGPVVGDRPHVAAAGVGQSK